MPPSVPATRANQSPKGVTWGGGPGRATGIAKADKKAAVSVRSCRCVQLANGKLIIKDGESARLPFVMESGILVAAA
jgi:hypothetical protein